MAEPVKLREVRMKSYYGLLITSSDKTSEEYLEVNNFGYYKDMTCDIKVNREHGRSDYLLFYLKNGEGVVRSDFGDMAIYDGNAVLFRPGEPQCYEVFQNEETEYYWIHFTGTGAEELLLRLGFESTVYKNKNYSSFARCIRKMSELSAFKNYRAERQRAGVLLTLLAELSGDEMNSGTGVIPALKNIDEFPEAGLSNAEYAKMCGLSTSHFIRRFREYTGMSPQSYRTELLLKKAAYLLQNTAMNISLISYELGFDDSLYFSRVFKKSFGVSPTKYRNSIK